MSRFPERSDTGTSEGGRVDLGQRVEQAQESWERCDLTGQEGLGRRVDGKQQAGLHDEVGVEGPEPGAVDGHLLTGVWLLNRIGKVPLLRLQAGATGGRGRPRTPPAGRRHSPTAPPSRATGATTARDSLMSWGTRSCRCLPWPSSDRFPWSGSPPPRPCVPSDPSGASVEPDVGPGATPAPAPGRDARLRHGRRHDLQQSFPARRSFPGAGLVKHGPCAAGNRGTWPGGRECVRPPQSSPDLSCHGTCAMMAR